MNCPNCDTQITFWMSLRQPTPFRFTCTRCKAKYQVAIPYMKTIIAVVVLVFTVLTLVCFAGTKAYGIRFCLPFLVLMIADWLLLELWTHKYIAERGTLTPIQSTRKKQEP